MALSIASESSFAPIVSQAELSAFHDAHFSSTTTSHFVENFLGPVAEAENEDVYGDLEDDGIYQGDNLYFEDEPAEDTLGFYPDGTKRNLTDEQIAIFRHSEVEGLLRARRRCEEAGERFVVAEHVERTGSPPPAVHMPSVEGDAGIPEAAGELRIEQATEESIATGKKGKKKKKSKNAGVRNLHVKPDLRKRTWDAVEKNDMGRLDYGEAVVTRDGASSGASSMQRRKISYEDD